NRRRVFQFRDRHFYVVPLTTVAHLSVTLEKNVTGSEFGFESFERLFFHRAEDFAEGADGFVVEQADKSLGCVDPGISEQHADSREVTRLWWDHHGWDRQLMGQRAGVEWPAAAITEEHEVTRIEPVLPRDPPDRSGHNHGGNGDHAVGHSDHAVVPTITQRLRDPFLYAAQCSVHVELHFAAEKVIG